MIIGYQGQAGSYSESACLQSFPNLTPKGFKTFEILLKAVKNDDISSALVPMEHSVVGTFFDVLDLIQKFDLKIIGEHQTIDHHCLAALPNTRLEDITEVESHPYVFNQCNMFLQTLENVKVIQSLDTSASAQNIASNGLKQTAVIASPDCAKMFGLKVLKSVADNAASLTRYVVVGKNTPLVQGHSDPKTSLLVVLRNTTGALAKCCCCFSHRDINISKVESRPSTSSIQIYFDVDASLQEARLVNAIQNLQEFGAVTVLGSYPKFRGNIENASSSLSALGIGM